MAGKLNAIVLFLDSFRADHIQGFPYLWRKAR
jgi:hypothetical protein